ncbi:hypothetical protein AN964_02775 [Heyndrickxia shackletonii]|uniref:Peptidase M50 domain-containing protein n=1 Tax=Heyndrickxia shackletonii TaxID=157838 RepID=A0A0Q3TEU2_9BACI|nr:site-2 protease family protein [Heyndrickxia shackletonii]KQL52566.1 hypothetical protein AN964_02775 [Heyndrickxia shackletonii]MBB2480557.1 site-2 protease family protein [Bacillus sp. APMAM]NEZ02453.1 hypothetical protein [Heyndrickxia shackletonii]RTZ56786.1 hypothetical protein EKO25_05840 [Bacillus sp. SAJ1]
MIIIWFLLFIAPLTLFIHEFGHSIGAYLVKSDKIQLFIGVGKRLFFFRISTISFHIHTFYMLGGHTASERDPYYSKVEQIIISLFGPLLNGVVGILSTLIFSASNSSVLLFFNLFNIWLCVINLIPYRIGDKQSDGYVILKIMFGRQNKRKSM